MTQSFDGLDLNADRSIVNFGDTKPPAVLDIPVDVVNSNSRTTPIVIKDGANSVRFQGIYQTLDGGQTSYDAIKGKQGKVGTLINDSQTVNNVLLRSVGLAQEMGNDILQCQLSFEYLGA
jgi:hypothetical protein